MFFPNVTVNFLGTYKNPSKINTNAIIEKSIILTLNQTFISTI